MVSFRRSIFAIAVLALLAGLASAQVNIPGTTGWGTSAVSTAPMACTAQYVNNTLRSEGAAEMVGDIVLTCIGGQTAVSAGQVVQAGSLVVNLSAPVTSRLLSSATGASDALLLIDEPGSVTLQGPGPTLPQTVVPSGAATTLSYVTALTPSPSAPQGIEACSLTDPRITLGTTVANANTYNSSGGLTCSMVPNVFEGIVNGTQVIFNGIPVLAPASTNMERIFRITNVRVSATSVGVVNFATVTAFVAFTTTVTPITPQQGTVGVVALGLSNSSILRNAGNTGNLDSTASGSTNYGQIFMQCISQPTLGSTPVGAAILRFVPGFGGAFKTRTLSLPVGFTGPPYGSSNVVGNTLGLTIPMNPASGFPSQNVPGPNAIFNPINYATYSESGLITAVPTGSTTASFGSSTFAGLADWGTRLKAEFVNVPYGVNIWVTTSNLAGSDSVASGAAPTSYNLASLSAGNNTTPIALGVLTETVADLQNFVQGPVSNITNSTGAGNVPIFQVPLTATTGIGTPGTYSGVAVWEVVQEPSNTTGDAANLDFGVFIQYTNTATSTVSTGIAQVGLSFAPTLNSGGYIPGLIAPSSTYPTPLTQATSSNIPRFADTSMVHPALPNIIFIAPCTTTLLFPYTSNTNGFETGMSIANTSADTVGTVTQTGTCTLTFFGTGTIVGGTTKTYTVAPYVTPAIPAGGVWADILSHIAAVPPNETSPGGGSEFTGYIFATCGFQYAHGFAFISDAAAVNLAEGYLALVVTNGGALNAFPQRGPNTGIPILNGEGLVH